MTTEELTVQSLQLKYAAFQKEVKSQETVSTIWNTHTSEIVVKDLKELAKAASIPADIAMGEFAGDKIIDFQLNPFMLEFVPATNGKIGVRVTEPGNDGLFIRSTEIEYHDHETLLSPQILLNYIAFFLDTILQWKSESREKTVEQ